MPTSVTNLSGSVVRGDWTGRMQIRGAPGLPGNPRSVGFARAIAWNNHSSYNSDTPGGRHWQTWVTQSLTEGFPSAPCISVQYPGFWRFRWVVKPGPRAVYVWAQQNSTGSINRPSMIVRSNTNVGLMADISASAPDGQGWQQMGPITFTATGNGAVWVELWNNLDSAPSASLFDHIITT